MRRAWRNAQTPSPAAAIASSNVTTNVIGWLGDSRNPLVSWKRVAADESACTSIPRTPTIVTPFSQGTFRKKRLSLPCGKAGF